MARSKKTVVILSVNGDIGHSLAARYLKEGFRVIGTYRSEHHVKSLRRFKDCQLFYCDVGRKKDVADFVKSCRKAGIIWDVFISCIGDPLPQTPFFKTNFEEWADSVQVNSLSQLRVLHQLYPLRRKQGIVTTVFLSGGGVNNAVVNFSAYTAAKMLLIKMCEFLDAENPKLNIFIIGPGWTRTKTHQRILDDPKISKSKYEETVKFLKYKKGTSLNDIYLCIEWLRSQGKQVASGRNFSVTHDQWKGKFSGKLAGLLKGNADMYKLRRFNNDYKIN